MICHIIPGIKGCEFGKENKLGVIIVDALRASATSALLLHSGVSEILAVKEIETAFRLKNIYPDITLLGERNALPPQGFDYGNSPLEALKIRARRVVFTTTTGVSLLFDAYPAKFVVMGTTVNLNAVRNFIKDQGTDVVIVPAGLYRDPSFPGEEDWATSALIAKTLECKIETGSFEYNYWIKKIDTEGIQKIFETSEHAKKLIAVNLYSDILFSAQLNLTDSIPLVVEKTDDYLIIRDAQKLSIK